MNRAAAINFARVGAEKLWAGTVTIHAGAKTGAHHHGELESVIYVLKGRARMRWGDALEFVAEAGPGDFIYVPPFVPHQEINASNDEPLECVLVRSGGEAVVVNLDIAPVEAPESVAWVATYDPQGALTGMRFIDRDEVARRLTYEVCIPIVREAMIAFSRGETMQHLRSIIPLADGRMFGIMPGAMGPDAPFGAKLISVYPENFALGKQSHQGLVILFDPKDGAPVCVVHAGEVTAIRTAAASAVATDALARADAAHLAILGYGEQAETHARAIAKVRASEVDHGLGPLSRFAAAFGEAHEHGARHSGVRRARRPNRRRQRRHHLHRHRGPRADPAERLGGAGDPHQSGRLQRRRPGGGGQRPCRPRPLHRRQPRRRPAARWGILTRQGGGPDRR